MAADISVPVSAPKIELKFLNRVKKTKILAAILCIVLTLVLSYLLYHSEYHYTIDKGDLSAAITEFITPFEPAFEAYVLETQAVGNTLIAFFKDQAHPDNYGVAGLVKGFNQRYRIVRTQTKASVYSSVVEIFPLEIKNERYYAVSGYNLSSDIHFYGLDYHAYMNPGYLFKDRVTQSIQFEVKNPQFLEIYPTDELDERAVNESSETLYSYHLTKASLYDADGNIITEKFRKENPGARAHSGTTEKAELFLLYVYIAIVIVLGIIMTRYFLTE
ncbi:MAG: hypothetical protein ACOWWO_14060 [Peptococcaceae bacterium]